MMRRRLRWIGLVTAALALVATPAMAQDYGSGDWEGSWMQLDGSGLSTGSVTVSAHFERRNPLPRRIEITLTTAGGPGGACATPGAETARGETPTGIHRTLRFECNGSYVMAATARITDGFGGGPETLEVPVPVSMPAPGVTGVSASGGGRSITIVWNDMRFAAKDLSGYVVERQVGGGDWTRLAALGADATSYVDEQLPASPGEATYRVSSTRPAPGGERVSAASTTSATPFLGAPNPPGDGDGTTNPGTGVPGDGTTDPGTGVPGDGTTSPGTGGTPGTPGAGGAPGGPSAPGTPGSGAGGGSRPAGGAVRVPRLGITGTFLPPLLRPTDAIQPPTTAEEDGGFSDELPYDDAEPGEQDPVLPDDELASVFSDDSAGRGMAIPVATALVLAVWAFHLRFLARAAAQPGAHVAR